jgi:hypothetical protein
VTDTLAVTAEGSRKVVVSSRQYRWLRFHVKNNRAALASEEHETPGCSSEPCPAALSRPRSRLLGHALSILRKSDTNLRQRSPRWGMGARIGGRQVHGARERMRMMTQWSGFSSTARTMSPARSGGSESVRN